MKITDFAVRNWRFTLICFLGVLAIGLASLFTMPRAEDPPFRAPLYAVIAVYPGTSAEDMEKLVVKPIEKKLQNLERLKRLSTDIRDGVASFRVEYQYGVSVDDKYQELTREVTALKPQLPAELTRLEVIKASSADVKIYQFALVSPTASYKDLKEWGEKLKDRLAPLKSLRNVDIWAVPDQEVRVEIDMNRLAASQIPLNRVIATIQGNNANIPGGGVVSSGRKFDVKTTSELRDVGELGAAVVSSSGKGTLLLRDVAQLKETYADETYRARLNGQRCIWVTVEMHDGQNIETVKAQVEPAVSAFARQLPPEIRLEKVFDQPKGVEDRMGRFARDFLLAILLVMVTLLPLGGRASLVVMIAIPLSLAIGLTALFLLGYTINQLSIVGMIVALGILVDDSIVVVENTERWLREGASRNQAAVGAAGQIAVAVLGCTILMVLAFLPLIFLPGGSGDFIRSMPMAVAACVLASLVVALTVVPFLSSRLLSAKHRTGGNFFLRLIDRHVIQASEPLARAAVRRPWITFAAAVGLFVLSLGLFPIIGSSLFPKSEKPMFLVNIQMPPGTSLDATDRLSAQVEKLLVGKPGIASVAANIGHDNPQVYYNVSSRDNAENTAQLLVQLSNPEIAFRTEIIAKLRHQLEQIAGARIEVKEFEQGVPMDAPVAVRIYCDDLMVLDQAAAQAAELMKQTEGTIYTNNPLEVKQTSLVIRVNKEKAGLYGVSPVQAARNVRLAVAGLEAGTLRSEGSRDDKTIRLVLKRDTRLADPQVLDRVYMDTPSGASLPLGQVARVEMDTGVTQIRHVDRQRTVVVGTFVKDGYNVARVNKAVVEKLQAAHLGPGVTLEVAGQTEASQESFSGIGTIILIAVFGFIGVLILEFRSFKSLLIVLSIIPLGLIGALVMLFLFGESFSFTATVGAIALTGIEVKNSLLFVDFANLLRSQGKPLDEAILEAGRMRFVPILLTSLTAIGGLIPLVAEYSPLYSPLALVLIGGILSSTVMARFVTPAVYKLFPPEVEVQPQAAT